MFSLKKPTISVENFSVRPAALPGFGKNAIKTVIDNITPNAFLHFSLALVQLSESFPILLVVPAYR
eukprot:8796427-Heterocapsa_arctica.AAC.1